MYTVDIDTVIIGAGFAGVETSLRLKAKNLNHIILEQHSKPLWSWRNQRWESFRMNTPHWSNRLFGQKDMVADEQVAMPLKKMVELWDQHINKSVLPFKFNTTVIRVSKIFDNGSNGPRFNIECEESDGTKTLYRAWNVIACPGAHQKPKVPTNIKLPDGVKAFDITSYKSPQNLQDGNVLIVGSGQTGSQLAFELLNAGKKVYMATSQVKGIPRSFRSMDIITAFEALGFFQMTKEKATEEQIYSKPPMIGADRPISYHSLSRKGAILLGCLESITEGGTAKFAADLENHIRVSDESYKFFNNLLNKLSEKHPHFEGSPEPTNEPEFKPDETLLEKVKNPIRELNLKNEKIMNVIWACGLSARFPWLNIPEVSVDFGKNGLPINTCTETVPGFYWVGFQFQRTFASHFLFGFGRDAQWIVDNILSKKLELQKDMHSRCANLGIEESKKDCSSGSSGSKNGSVTSTPSLYSVLDTIRKNPVTSTLITMGLFAVGAVCYKRISNSTYFADAHTRPKL